MAYGGDENTHHARLAFGRRVRSLRKACGMSQEQLADAAGLHRTYVSSLERGERNVGLDNVVILARALGVSPAQLFEEP
jgi:transcriptional regulator with XRE-family HTH domain